MVVVDYYSVEEKGEDSVPIRFIYKFHVNASKV